MHDAVWVRQLAADLKRRGYPTGQILARVGLDEKALGAERARIPFTKHAAFFELAAGATGDVLLGLKFGQSRDTRDAGVIGYLGLSSSSLAHATRSLSRYRRVFTDAVEIQIDDPESPRAIRWTFNGVDPDASRQCIEFAAANFIRAVRDGTGIRVVPASITLAHRRTGPLHEFEEFFGVPVGFGRDANVITLRPADLLLPFVRSDDRLEAILRHYCEELLKESDRQHSLIAQVENLVAAGLTQGSVKIEEVAKELGMSSRSLTRRLSELDTSFGRIVQELRRKLALKYLGEGELAVTEVAFLLGYSEVSTFNHSFRRWTGKSPTQYKREL
jgi:AraC-like DNA-binding protein